MKHHTIVASLFFAAALAAPFPAAAERIDLQAADKLILYGGARGDVFGSGVAAGDFDGDGIDDLAIGAPGGDGEAPESRDIGRVYVFFGGPERTIGAGTLPLGDAGLVIVGGVPKENLGLLLDAGDVDGDGRDDLLVGTFQGTGPDRDRSGSGTARLFFGRPRGRFPAVWDLASQPADVTIYGTETNDHLTGGIAVGDLDGDGRDDLALGAFYGDGPDDDRHHAGEVSILFGAARGELPAVIDLAHTPIPTVYGAEASDTFGRGVAIGDVDGDGRGDLVVGAYYGDGPENDRINGGEAYVVFGGPRARFPLKTDLAAVPVHVLYGEHEGDLFGRSVAVVDLNGDGRGEVVVGAHSASPDPEGDPASNAGVVYVLYGRPEAEMPDTMDMRDQAEVRLLGRWGEDNLGWPVRAGAWGPNRGALLALARRSDGGDLGRATAGEAFVIPAPGRAFHPIENVDDVARFSLVGMHEADKFGYDGVTLDWNGDGRPEVAVSSTEAKGPRQQEPRTGQVIVYFPSAP